MSAQQPSAPAKTRIYRVGYNFECGAAVFVEAGSPADATAIVEAALDDTHEELPSSDSLHFECSIVEVELAEKGARLPKPAIAPALLLDARQAQALRELVRYLYDQEASDYAACEAAKRNNHVFSEIRILALACGHVGAEDLAQLDATLASEEV